jgi:hypothetical protein
MTPVTILDAIADDRLFGRWFRNPTWSAWFAFLAAAFGLPMTAEQETTYRQCTGPLQKTFAPLRRSLARVREARWQVLHPCPHRRE